MTTVVWYDSSEVGAPTLNNAAGSLDAILNACLVTGFRVVTLDSITVAGGVATANFAAGHGYGDRRVLEIAGAATPAINGRKLIARTGAGTFTFPAPGVADGAVAGTITARRAPLGWARPLSSGNVSIYQRTDVQATAMCLRVDDSGSSAASATAARWRMVESFSDLNTFTGAAPAASVLGGAGAFITKGFDSAAAKPWVLVGDGRTFYLFTDASGAQAVNSNGSLQGLWMFGDIEAYRAGDAFACLLAGASSSNVADNTLGAVIPLGSAPSSDPVVFPRPFNGIGSPVQAAMLSIGSNRRLGSGGPAYPSPVDNGLPILAPVLVAENNTAFNHPVRGHLRGLGDPVASIALGSLHLQVLDTVAGSDRRWLLVAFNQNGAPGHAAFDITGPW